jgi:hypothetical protein
MYSLMLGKPQTRVKCLLHTDWVILRLHRRAGSKELFAPKEIQILKLMDYHKDQGSYHLSQPLGVKSIGILKWLINLVDMILLDDINLCHCSHVTMNTRAVQNS